MLCILNGIFEPEYFLDLVLFTTVPFVTEKINQGTRIKLKHELHKQLNLHKIYYHKINLLDYDARLEYQILIKPTLISPTYAWNIELLSNHAWNPVLLIELSENDRIEQYMNTKFKITRLH